ncbi:MAG: hypothetical protein ACREQR_14945 [Candidatus Binataceae bacterium]
MNHHCFTRATARLAIVAAFAIAASACGSGASPQKVNSKIGCDLNASRVCQNSMLQAFGSGGWMNGSLFNSYYSQNSNSTAETTAYLNLPSGARIDVNCSINMAQKKVVYAYPATRAALVDSDRQWLHQTGMCIGSGGAEAAAKVGTQE